MTHGYEWNLEQLKIFICAYDADKASFKELFIETKDWLTLNVHSSVQVDGQSISQIMQLENNLYSYFDKAIPN